MSRAKVFAISLVVGLLALLIPLSIVLAQVAGTGTGSVAMRDSDDTKFSAKLSDMAMMKFKDLPVLASNKRYEGWLVSDSGPVSTGILKTTEGVVDQTFWRTVAESSITVKLDEMNSSGQSGTATLTAKGAETEVAIDVTAGDVANDPQPVHIHLGTCGAGLGGVDFPLSGVVAGKSTTTVKERLDILMDGNHAINLHKSGPEIGVYTTCGNIPTGTPTGENLFANFHTFVISVEPVPDTDPAPSADKPYVKTIPAGALAHIRHLAYSFGPNPVYTAGFHKDTPKGIAVGLREQAALAWAHANLALNSTDLATTQQHAEHVINIINGGAGEDLDGVGGAQNPGDKGPGVLGYADDAVAHSGLSAGQAAGDQTILNHAKEVADSAAQAKGWALLGMERAQAALAAADFIVAKAAMANAADRLGKTLNGFDADADGTVERITGEGGAKQAYWASQDMGMYVFAPPVAGQPQPEATATAEPPKTGDNSVPGLAFPGLILGMILLAVGGSVLFGLSRRRSSAL